MTESTTSSHITHVYGSPVQEELKPPISSWQVITSRKCEWLARAALLIGAMLIAAGASLYLYQITHISISISSLAGGALLVTLGITKYVVHFLMFRGKVLQSPAFYTHVTTNHTQFSRPNNLHSPDSSESRSTEAGGDSSTLSSEKAEMQQQGREEGVNKSSTPPSIKSVESSKKEREDTQIAISDNSLKNSDSDSEKVEKKVEVPTLSSLLSPISLPKHDQAENTQESENKSVTDRIKSLLSTDNTTPPQPLRTLLVGSNIIEKHTVSLMGNFHEIILDSNVELIISVGQAQDLSVKIDDNLFECINCHLQDHKLSLGIKPEAHFKTEQLITYYLTLPSIQKLQFSGQGNIRLFNIVGDISCTITGEIALTLCSGRVSKQSLVLSGQAIYNSTPLSISKRIKIVVRDEATASLNDSKSLKAKVTGQGECFYRGHPKIKKLISEEGKLCCLRISHSLNQSPRLFQKSSLTNKEHFKTF